MARLTSQGIHKNTTAFIRDICTNGMGIYTNENYGKGDLLVVHFSYVTEKQEIIDESITGAVVWTTPIGKRDYAVGIQFDGMKEERPRLFAYIKRLEELTNEYL